jgi:type II restriction enzyme
LKCQSHSFGKKIVDAGYEAMMRAMKRDKTPNLFALQYDAPAWIVSNLILIPRFAYSSTAIEPRPPLPLTARRAGWVGCHILLDAIPSEARIPIITAGGALRPSTVRSDYARFRPLAKLKVKERGWTLDVLRVVQNLGKKEISMLDVYAADEELARLHPANRHIRPKIRQQLQVLRDLGFLQFLGHGRYRLR